jgi:hypothetical protein
VDALTTPKSRGKLDLHGLLLFIGSACLLTLGFELAGHIASPALSGMLILAGFFLLLATSAIARTNKTPCIQAICCLYVPIGLV